MTSKNIGIEEARKQLGDLITAVQQGSGDIIITRNGKPAARLTRHQESTMVTATDITATIARPSADEVYDGDWNWADAATEVWLRAAQAAGLTVNVMSYEVTDPTRDAAIVEVNGTAYVLEARDDEVRAVQMAFDA